MRSLYSGDQIYNIPRKNGKIGKRENTIGEIFDADIKTDDSFTHYSVFRGCLYIYTFKSVLFGSL